MASTYRSTLAWYNVYSRPTPFGRSVAHVWLSLRNIEYKRKFGVKNAMFWLLCNDPVVNVQLPNCRPFFHMSRHVVADTLQRLCHSCDLGARHAGILLQPAKLLSPNFTDKR